MRHSAVGHVSRAVEARRVTYAGRANIYDSNRTNLNFSWRWKEERTPIRLTHSPSRCSVIPVAGIKLGIGRRLCVASDAEQRTEGVERVEAPVEPKREFVEVGL